MILPTDSVIAAIHQMLSIPLDPALRLVEVAAIKQIAAVNHFRVRRLPHGVEDHRSQDLRTY